MVASASNVLGSAAIGVFICLSYCSRTARARQAGLAGERLEQTEDRVRGAGLEQVMIEAALLRDHPVRRLDPLAGDRDHERPARIDEAVPDLLRHRVAADAGHR